MYALPHLLRSHAQGLTVRHGPGLMPTAGIICGTILHNAMPVGLVGGLESSGHP